MSIQKYQLLMSYAQWHLSLRTSVLVGTQEVHRCWVGKWIGSGFWFPVPWLDLSWELCRWGVCWESPAFASVLFSGVGVVQNQRENYWEISGTRDHNLNTLTCLCMESWENCMLQGTCSFGSMISGKILWHKGSSEVKTNWNDGGIQRELSSSLSTKVETQR